jgi:hypothetical protein
VVIGLLLALYRCLVLWAVEGGHHGRLAALQHCLNMLGTLAVVNKNVAVHKEIAGIFRNCNKKARKSGPPGHDAA